jgi:hypothetical protein
VARNAARLPAAQGGTAQWAGYRRSTSTSLQDRRDRSCCRSNRPPRRPARTRAARPALLAVTQILDDRETAAGKLTLDLRATGRGVLPELPELLGVALAGFTVVKTNDSGVTVTKLDTENDDLAALSERAWVFEPARRHRQGPATFRFPPALART